MSRLVLAATVANAVAVLPFFLIGGLTPLLRSGLGLTERDIGIAAAMFSVGSTAGAAAAGRVTEAIGVRAAVRLGCFITLLGLLLAAVSVRGLAGLSMCLALTGVGNAIIQPAVNAALSRHVPIANQGLAFGIKQGSIPIAALLTGLALASFGPGVGWRALFVLAAVFPIVGVWMAKSLSDASRLPAKAVKAARALDLPLWRLATLGAAGFLAATAATGMGVFYVEGAIATGSSVEEAGWWYALGAMCCVAGRIGWGWLGGRQSRSVFRLVVLSMGLGSCGLVLLGGVPSVGMRAFATVLAWGAGWGWPGMFTYGVVRANRNAPAAATGITQTGLFAGALVGPLIFGAAIASGWTSAWRLAGLIMGVGALTLIAQRSIPGETKALATDELSR